jgi:hypothetical protein
VEAALRIERFKDVLLTDPFFDTLKDDYPGFANWFAGKSDKEALTFRTDSGALDGFLYVKERRGRWMTCSRPLRLRAG